MTDIIFQTRCWALLAVVMVHARVHTQHVAMVHTQQVRVRHAIEDSSTMLCDASVRLASVMHNIHRLPSLAYLPVQNPVNTMAWVSANFQLLGPIISVTVETRLFVQPIFRTGPLLLLAVAYTALATLAVMAGPTTHANAFRLFHFPQLYRFQCEGIGVGAVVNFYVCITVTRRLLRWHQQRRIQPT